MTLEELAMVIKNKIPDKAIDIGEALDLLLDTLNSTRMDIGTNLQQANNERDFTLLEQLAAVSKELTTYEEKLQEFRNLCELDIEPDAIDVEPEKDNTLPDYEQYRVDNKIEYTLYENLTNKRPFAFELGCTKVLVKTWQGMLLKTVEILSSRDQVKMQSFATDKKMNGRKTCYFSISGQNNMRKPVKISNAEFFVETNQSANSIRNLIIRMLQRYNIKMNDFKIYLLADYSELHS